LTGSWAISSISTAVSNEIANASTYHPSIIWLMVESPKNLQLLNLPIFGSGTSQNQVSSIAINFFGFRCGRMICNMIEFSFIGV
jgi:hypothetical protein